MSTRHQSALDLRPADELETRLFDLVDEARADHPAIQRDDRAFARHIAAHMPEHTDWRDALEGLCAADLYIAWGCLRRDPHALAALERELASHIPDALERIDGAAEFASEVIAAVRHKLLARADGIGPKIAQYGGRGNLSGWLRTEALRVALGLRGGDRPPALGEHQADFEEALRDGFRALALRERNVLKLSYLDGLSIERLGALFGVHQATAARWLARARNRLQEGTLNRLRNRITISELELESVVRAVQSALDISLTRLFKTRGRTRPD